MDNGSDCCTPRFVTRGTSIEAPALRALTGSRHRVEQRTVPGGTFRMGDGFGDGHALDGERPVRAVTVEQFEIDATSVTNADFAAFVDETGHRTEAEVFGFSAVFHLVVAADRDDVIGAAPDAPWWFGVRGADWRHPEGRASGLAGRADHPVVHVSWNDARAYAVWAGRRLPTEAEWERASRGGLESARFPWGDDLLAPDGSWRTNIWQGTFPTRNTEEDGWATTAPVRSFEPNGFGLWQTVGNVWEWCEDRFDAGTNDEFPLSREIEVNGSGNRRVLKGGSYLCHDSYCNRYRNSARSSNTPDSSGGHMGFRTVAG